MKNRSHKYDINRPKSRREHKYSKYIIKCHIRWSLYVLNNTQATFKSPIMKTLSNIEAGLKISVAY